MNCKYCGNSIGDGQRFCSECGAEVEQSSSSKKRSKRLLLIGIVAIVVAIIAGVVAWRAISGISSNDQGGNSTDNPTNYSEKVEENESQASDEETLKQSVTQAADHEILHWFYADLDNDGDDEAFAITGVEDGHLEGAWSEGEVWFADESGVKRLAGREAGNMANGLVEDAATGYRFLSLEFDAGGSGSSSTVFAASNGFCAQSTFDLDGVGQFHEKDGQLIGYTQTWDNGFHEYVWHSFEFDPSELSFRSTGIVDVTTLR